MWDVYKDDALKNSDEEESKRGSGQRRKILLFAEYLTGRDS